jgi:TatD DNase family protein
MQLIDTHAHLDMSEFAADLPQVIQRAQAAGVSTIMTVGIDLASCRKALQIAGAYPGIFAILGIHPHDAAQAGERDLDELKALARHKKVKAWGEIGLDFFRNLSPRAIQLAMFRRQITIAKELRLPLVIHSRAATAETIACLREERANAVEGVIHCFSGDARAAKEYLEMGFCISIPGVITFNKAQMLREVVKGLPADKLLVETDAPFLAPMPHRGKRNEPAYVQFTAAVCAKIRGEDISALADYTAKNACRVFHLDKK